MRITANIDTDMFRQGYYYEFEDDDNFYKKLPINSNQTLLDSFVLKNSIVSVLLKENNSILIKNVEIEEAGVVLLN